jgi:hypothetical protein
MLFQVQEQSKDICLLLEKEPEVRLSDRGMSVRFLALTSLCVFLTVSRAAVEPDQPPIQSVPAVRREARHVVLSSKEVKFALQQTMKTQWGNNDIAVLFL